MAEDKKANLALKKAEKAVARRYAKRALHAMEKSPIQRSKEAYQQRPTEERPCGAGAVGRSLLTYA